MKRQRNDVAAPDLHLETQCARAEPGQDGGLGLLGGAGHEPGQT